MGDFFNEFNKTLDEFQKHFGEQWTFDGNTFDAIEISEQSSENRRMIGGVFVEGSVTITLKKSVFMTCGVFKGATVTVRGQNFSVASIANDGIDDITLVCGPEQVDVFQ